MARPRKTTEELEKSGAFDKNPKRAEDRLTDSSGLDPIGDPPEGMSESVSAAWREIVATCQAGVLTTADRIIVGVAARLLAKEDRGKIEIQERNQLIKILDSFGMCPKGRNYVKPGAGKKAENIFATL